MPGIKKYSKVLQEHFNFSINKPVNASENTLVIQLSSSCFRYGIYRNADNSLLELKQFPFAQANAKDLDEIIAGNPVLEEGFNNILCGFDFGFNTLLPAEMSDADSEPFLFLENADQQDHVIREPISGMEITNLYTVPPDILTWMVQNFPSAVYFHQHTSAILAAGELPEAGLLRVDVQSNYFTVLVFKGRQLQLSRNYGYAQPADMAFYLLKICEQFQLSQEQVIVRLSGFVDTGSKLYRGIYDYFLNVVFKSVTWADNITQLPAHYFTSLNELSLCGLFQET